MNKADQALTAISDMKARTDMAVATQNLARTVGDNGSTGDVTCKACGVVAVDKTGDICVACKDKLPWQK